MAILFYGNKVGNITILGILFVYYYVEFINCSSAGVYQVVYLIDIQVVYVRHCRQPLLVDGP